MSEDGRSVAEAVAQILDTSDREHHPAIGELVRIRSATRRVIEADLDAADEDRLLRGIAAQAVKAQLPMWALDAILAELRDPEPWPVPPLTWEQAQRRLRQQGAMECPVCRTPVPSETEFRRWERRRMWNREDADARRSAAPLAEVTR
jgi:hypothetical protein